MSIAEQLPLAEVENRLSEVVEQVESEHARVTITKHGRPAAQRAVQRLPENVATACVEFVYPGLADNPRRVGKPLRFELEGQYCARRGDYRASMPSMTKARQ